MATAHASGSVALGGQICPGFFINLSRSCTQPRTNTIRQLSRKEKRADGADNLWFLVLIIKGCLFIPTPGARTVNP